MDNLKLGILVAKIENVHSSNGTAPKLPEPKFYEQLAILAPLYGIDLYVFSSNEWLDQKLYGYRLQDKQWRREPVALPDIIYDRCFFTSTKQKLACEQMLQELKRKQHYISFNSNLPNKLLVYEALRTVEELIPFLPYTEPLQSLSCIAQWLTLYPQGVVLKPAAGMQGKGILHLFHNVKLSQYEVRGRNLRNESFQVSFSSELNLLKWLYRFKKDMNYVIQPYLQLSGEDGKPFDIRVLMQKDQSGLWQLTGSVARVGVSSGLTSNLHGGGEALDPVPMLTSKMGSFKAERLLQNVHMISGQTVNEIEGHFGRFGELALDFGITPQGSIWVLECNSKPGRQAFNHTANELPLLAHERPLQYALYLQQRQARNQKVI